MAKGEQQPQEIKLLIIHPGGDPFDSIPDNKVDLAWKNLAEKFAEYKTNTGIPAKALGLWEINRDFDGNDTAERIKKAIKHYYTNHGLKYVILVGDCDVFPVRFYFKGWKDTGETWYSEDKKQVTAFARKVMCSYPRITTSLI